MSVLRTTSDHWLAGSMSTRPVYLLVCARDEMRWPDAIPRQVRTSEQGKQGS